MKRIDRFFESTRRHFEKGGKLEKLYPFYESIETVFFAPARVSRVAPNMRDSLDVKRYMMLVIVALLRGRVNSWEVAALLICTAVISSYLTMNFTGSTPYTSPSGVEKEMRRAIPFQAGAALTVPVLWIAAAFT